MRKHYCATRGRFLLSLLLLLAGVRFNSAAQQRLYYLTSDGNTAAGVNDALSKAVLPAGTPSVVAASIAGIPNLMTLDVVNNRAIIYDAATPARVFKTIDLATGAVVTLPITQIGSNLTVSAIEYDAASGYLYYLQSNRNSATDANEALFRVTLAGASGPAIATAVAGRSNAMTLELANNQAIINDVASRLIKTVNLTTGIITTLPITAPGTSAMPVTALRYDAVSGLLYYLVSDGTAANTTNDVLMKATLNGTTNAVVARNIASIPALMTLDVASQQAIVYDDLNGSRTFKTVSLTTGAMNPLPSIGLNDLAVTALNFPDPTTVVSINRVSASLTNAASVSFTVTFARSVMGVSASNFALPATGSVAGASISSVSGSGTTYTVAVNTGSGDGTLGLNLVNTDGMSLGVANLPVVGQVYTLDKTPPVVVGVADGGLYNSSQTITFNEGTGVLNAAAFASGGVVSAQRAHTLVVTDAAGNATTVNFSIDTTPALITNVGVPANGTYRIGQALPFTVNFSEVVLVTTAGGTPTLDLTLNTGGTVAAAYVSGSGTTALLFRYVVAAGNLDQDGIALAGALALNGGTVRDAATNNAGLTLNGVPSTAGVLVDGVAPAVLSSNRQTPTSATTNATALVYRVTFSEGVSGVTASAFSPADTGTAAGTVASVTAVSASVYDVAVSGASGDGTLRLDMKSSVTGIADAAGNALSGGFTTGQTFTLDHTAPSVTISSPAASPTTTSPIPFTVTFAEAVTGFSASGLTVSNGTLSGLSGSGTTYSFMVTPSGVGAVTVTVGANAARDAAGNFNTASAPFSRSYTQTVTWNGSVSTDWFTAANWTGGVPTAQLDAVIGAGNPRYPLLATGTATAKSLTLAAGGSLGASGGTLDLKAAFVNNGAFSATGGVVSLSGAAQQAVGGSSLSRFWDLTVGPAGASQAGAAALQRVLTLNGSLTTNGQDFTLLSTASGTAMVVNNSGTVVGRATVQRFISSDGATGNMLAGYRHYSTPVSGSTVADLATNTDFVPVVNGAFNTAAAPRTVRPFPTVYGYDQSRLTTTSNNLPEFDKGWFSPAALTDALAAGRGYTVNIGASQLVDFNGTLFNGDLGLVLDHNAGSAVADANWHMLGNPYPAPLDFRLVAPADRPGLDAALYVFESTAQYAGQYRTFVNGVGSNPVVPVAQGFFMRVSSGQSTGSFTFRNSQRLTAFDPTPFRRGAEADTRLQLQLTLGSAASVLRDDAYVYFEAGAPADADPQFDATKLTNATGLNLATTANGELLAINGLPLPGPALVIIPLTMQVPAVGTYTLTATKLLNMPVGAEVLLRDTQLNTLTRLQPQSTYTFTTTLLNPAPRFALVVGSAQVLAATAAAQAAEVALYPNPASTSVTVELPATLWQSTVVASLADALGRIVKQQVLPRGQAAHKLSLEGVPAGVYSLRLQADGGQVVQKLVVE